MDGIENFHPLLAMNADLKRLKFPVLVSPKLDGIRAFVLNQQLLSRKLKPIPNRHVQKTVLEYRDRLEQTDGELIVGNPVAPNVFQATESGVMSEGGTPDFKFHLFDYIGYEPYMKRLARLAPLSNVPFVVLVEQIAVENLDQLMIVEQKFVTEGYEGVMVRSLDGRYKFGRSTVREGILLKVKRFVDEEATVIGFEERLHNANPLERDAFGYAKRSSHQAGKVPTDTLGALVVQSPNYTEPFNIGTGFDDAMRKHIWTNREKYMGMLVTFKHQPHGEKDRPRFPVFKGFRHPDDL